MTTESGWHPEQVKSAKLRSASDPFNGREMIMDIKNLTAEMHKFVSSKGWYDEDSPRPQTPRNLAISLSLESAEVLEHFQWREIR